MHAAAAETPVVTQSDQILLVQHIFIIEEDISKEKITKISWKYIDKVKQKYPNGSLQWKFGE